MDHKSADATKFTKISHDIFNGKATISRLKPSGDVWQFRMWIPEEKKYVRESLRTKDLKTAIDRAETRVFEIFGNIAAGKKLFGITLGELVEKYIKSRKEDTSGGQITHGRVGTIRSQLKHLTTYKGAQARMSELDLTPVFDYAQWRRATKGAEDVTIRNEQATINHMMEFAFRNGYVSFDEFEFAKIRIAEVSRRDTFTLREYDDLVRYMRKWVGKDAEPDETLRNERLMIRDCILIASNTMLRVGELWKLKWSDITGYEPIVDEIGKSTTLVTLHVRKEIAKNRKSRQIACRGGEYLKRHHQRTSFRSPGDYIFCGKSGSELFPEKKFYAAWASLMKGIGLDYKSRNVKWYSLRHFGITCRLRAGASVYDVAQIAGTGVQYIESNYGHFDQSMARAC